jgi:hypothetical protein
MTEDTLMQSQSILFAAALFIFCTIFDAQGGDLQREQGAQAADATGPAEARPAMSTEQRRLFAEAVRLYRGGAWSAAYGRFAALADHGEPRAARIALAMVRDGPQRYKTHWDASPAQLQAWSQAAGGAAPAMVLVSSD